MPELPRQLRREVQTNPALQDREREGCYAELHCRSNFSFLEGASHPDELVNRAAELGLSALAVTDRNSLAGVVRAHVAAKAAGLKLLVGAEIWPVDAPPVVLLAIDRDGYGQLSKLITAGRRRAEKGECRILFSHVAEYSRGLLCCVLLRDVLAWSSTESGNPTRERGMGESSSLAYASGYQTRGHRIDRSGTRQEFRQSGSPKLLTSSATGEAARQLIQYRRVFGDRCYGLAELHRGPDDAMTLARMLRVADEAEVPVAAANDVHYHIAERQQLQDVLTAIRHGCTVAELGDRRFCHAERALKSAVEMRALFELAHQSSTAAELVARTTEIADRCHFSLDELRYEYPEELCPPGMTPFSFLNDLTWTGATKRYPDGIPEKVRRLLEHELALIRELRYEAYFLTVWDLVRFARKQKILCQGRGSAANSAVCFCLGVTSVDPDRIDILFERFISKERDEAPDIDVDFEHERREEVLQYIYDKYGRDRAGMTATVITYRMRSAVRDVGKALGFSQDRIDRLAKSFDHLSGREELERHLDDAGMLRGEEERGGEKGSGGEEIDDCRVVIGEGGSKSGKGRAPEGRHVIARGANPGFNDAQQNVSPEGATSNAGSNSYRPSGASGNFVASNEPGVGTPGYYMSPLRGSGPTSTIDNHQSAIDNHQSAINNHQSAINNHQSAINNHQSAINNHQSAINNHQSAINNHQSAIDNHQSTIINHSSNAGRHRQAGNSSPQSEIPSAKVTATFCKLIREILDFPRHLSQHVGGMVFTNGLLSELVPIENASMPGRTVIQWDKNDIEALGILKVDCLSLGMLSAIRKCFDFVRVHHDRPLTLATVPAEDPQVYAMISRADTIGVFQIESRAQMSMLPRLRPREFYDFVIEVAIVRPGPIQGDMVHPYLRRRAGEEAVSYPDERVKEVLHKTLGVPIFQEQAMRLAVVAAGFTPGEADQLRRAMGAWRRRGVIDQFHTKLIDGMAANGYDADFAERVFRQIQGFGEYGFPESHAASFALLVYVSAWLKKYYPAAFAASIINSMPMGFYAPAQLIADAKRHGVEVRSVDVCHSEWDCTLEPTDVKDKPAIRLGFRMVTGLGEDIATTIVGRRQNSMFHSFDDFAHRTGLSSAVLSRLSNADAFGSLELKRRTALWRSLPDRAPQPLYDSHDSREPCVALPEMTELDSILADYKTTGLSLKGHPLEQLRPLLTHRRIVKASELPNIEPDRKVRVAGLVLIRQHPSTARGITFVTLEDETGTANLVIHPSTWNYFRVPARTASALIARGMLQKEGEVIHVVVDHLEDMSAALRDTPITSRNFR